MFAFVYSKKSSIYIANQWTSAEKSCPGNIQAKQLSGQYVTKTKTLGSLHKDCIQR